ncbi:hypothetical protein FB451DRAFT_1177070 [Mycena latifolia]|nr:hypothetical protein FB451DRAFT_1177070 [Mycena latifolia]
MSGFPRACFSEKELNATRWYAQKNGVFIQPTIKEVKNHHEDILNVAALGTKFVDGKLGNSLVVNDWFKILKHEFANPLVRPKLQLNPEDSGEKLEEARQAAKWKCEVDGNISGAMSRGSGGKDYYIEEVCFMRIASNGDVGPIMPMQWFTRDGELWSVAHPLHLTPSRSAFVIDGREHACIEIPLENYFLNVLDLEDPDCQARYNISPPSEIAGILHDPTLPLEDWTQPFVNEWRVKGAGRRVHSVPLWTYCDDTSGNISKKWNKHNSILFTLAGLPRALTQMLYNIHFIATSNLSPPLEIIEAVTAMLKDAQKSGIKVWDCVYKEWILIIPWFLVFQSDNPIMKGKYFCRVCQAKSDKNNHTPGHAGEVDRLKEFMTAGTSCTKEETIADLTAQLKCAIDGAPSAVDDMATDSGSKDKYFQHFLNKLQAAGSKLRDEQKEHGPGPSESGISEAEEVKICCINSELRCPIIYLILFFLFSILHVVLLAVVKYWWRDAVSRQNSKGKEDLKARLSSVDVAGLNTPPIRGNTSVQYAGSLVGRDFRAKLNHAIFDFLCATALWNAQWFNKPKFHLFVHLAEHIHRFGPLILYATESFESFNLAIRLRSIHSSKHAPSLDIATAFSHLHAVRHLVSGGYVLEDEDGDSIPPRQAGAEVLALLEDEQFLKFMSMDGLKAESKAVGTAPCPWPGTDTRKLGISSLVREGDKELVCAVNVNHNCAANHCEIALTRRVLQERRRTKRFENEVSHAVEPNDCVLNLAQLRSATDVQKSRSDARFPGLSLAEAIEASIRNKERLEQNAKEAEEAKELERQEKEQGKQKAKAKQPRKMAANEGEKGAGRAGGSKRKRVEIDRDFAEGGEDLVYVPPHQSNLPQAENRSRYQSLEELRQDLRLQTASHDARANAQRLRLRGDLIDTVGSLGRSPGSEGLDSSPVCAAFELSWIRVSNKIICNTQGPCRNQGVCEQPLCSATALAVQLESRHRPLHPDEIGRIERADNQVPDSSGPRRTFRSPRRHSPYAHGSHRRGSENRNPLGPTSSGDFSSQYAPYNNGSSGSTGDYERAPFYTVAHFDSNYDMQPRRLPALTTMYGLDNSQCRAPHNFSKLSSDVRAVSLFLRLLQTEQQYRELRQDVQTEGSRGDHRYLLPAKLNALEETTPLLRHYIIRPITSYTNLVAIVETYIHDHATQLHLELYKQDPIVRSVVHELLSAENHSIRSALRKLIFSVKVVNGYHLATIPAKPPKNIMACLALTRKVARALVSKESARGGGTGFWANLERELDMLFEKNWNKRENAKCLRWLDGRSKSSVKMIRGIFITASKTVLGPRRRSMQRSLPPLLMPPPPPSGPSTIPRPDGDDENTGELETLDGRDLSISGLGDLAALSAGPVARS